MYNRCVQRESERVLYVCDLYDDIDGRVARGAVLRRVVSSVVCARRVRVSCEVCRLR